MYRDMDIRERDEHGRFATDVEEARLENFSFRVPASLKNKVKQVAGKRTAEWLREAIAEKLEREQQMSA